MKVEIYQDWGDLWRWRLRAKNTKIIADSAEGYARKKHTVSMARKLFPDAEIVYLEGQHSLTRT